MSRTLNSLLNIVGNNNLSRQINLNCTQKDQYSDFVKSRNVRLVSKSLYLLFIFFFVLFSTKVFSTNYYVSSSTGNDSNSGTSENAAWQTLEKVNSFIPSAGDQILFKRGDVWEGSITINSSGAAGAPIVIGSYGSGEKPKIYGSEKITNWTVYSGNIYKATVNKVITQLFLDDKRMQVARFPNSGYIKVSSVSGTTQLSAGSLSTGINYTGAKLHIKTNEWRLDSKSVVGSSGQTLTIDSNTSYGLKTGQSFFLCNKLEFLDKAGQWYFDSNTNTIYLWTPTGDSPENHIVRGSVFSNGIEVVSKDYITIQNLHLLQHSEKGIYTKNSDNLIIENNEINDVEFRGIAASGNRITVNNNIIERCNQFALTIGGTSSTITNNTCKNTALFDNLGINGMNGFSYVMSVGGDNNTIQYNKIINAGYTGLSWTGKNCKIEYNNAENLMQVLSDGGAIYTYSRNIDSPIVSGSVIRNNIIRNLNHGTAAIYMDERTRDVTIENNTIAHCKGYAIFFHDNMNIEARNNNLFDNSKGVRASMTYGGNKFHNNVVCNISTTKDGTNYPALLALLNPDEKTLELNNNTYVDHYCPYPFRNTKTYDYQTFESWKSTMGQDLNSTFNYYSMSDGETEMLFYNSNKSTKNINLGTTVYRDVLGNRVTGTLILAPFTSKILIKTNEVLGSNQYPVINSQTFQVDGNTGADNFVGQVVATDPDTEQSLTYSITQGNSENLFSINAETGNIYTNTTLQITQDTVIELLIEVTDNGTTPLSSNATITINITGVVPPDNTAPVVSSFLIPSSSDELTIPILEFVASDNKSVAGYLITESATMPSPDYNGWITTVPETYTFDSEGVKTLYAWVKDSAGNISGVNSEQVIITLPDLSPVYSKYSFEEVSGNTVFDSNNNIDGTVVNSVLVTEGACGNGMLFNGSGYITLGNNYSNNVKTEVTLSAWVKPNTSSTGFQGIIMHGGDNIDTYALYINPDVKSIGFKTTGTSIPWSEIENINSLWNGNWHQICATYNGVQKIIYLDGDVILTENATGPIETGVGHNLLIGAGRDYQNPILLYSGVIDEVNIHNYALSASQIKENFNTINSCLNTVNVSEDISICEGSEYMGWYTEGEYQRTLKTTAGFDSIVTTNLTVNPTYQFSEDITINQGENYLGLNESGTYERLLTSSLGCDSVVITHLTVLPSIITEEEVSICEGESYQGWTESGEYSRTFTASNGADSTIITLLYVNPSYHITENIRILEGDVYNGWSHSGVYERGLTSSMGCDSIVTTNLTVMNTIFTEEEIEICEGEDYLGWTESGEYERVLTAASGADSVVITLLHVHPKFQLTEEITIKEDENYNGWTQSGTYERMITSVFGCDSLVITNLNVLQTIYNEEEVSICQDESYKGWTESGEYWSFYTADSGADSVVITLLNVNHSYQISEEITINQGENYQGWTESGTYERQLTTFLGCDSLVITHLTVLPAIITEEQVTICEGESYNGWTESGEYEQVFTASNGADSIIVTLLHVNPSYEINETIRIPEGESYNGWTENGIYQRALSSSFGCDSIVTTNLIVMTDIYTEVEVSICEGESYQGWNKTGEYQKTYTASSGADSVVITLLYVHPGYQITEDVKIKDGENYLGWSTPGTYERMLTSKFGCDSLIITNLSVLETIYTEGEISICQGESYNGWTESGEYWSFHSAASGADSVVITMLHVNPSYQITEDIIINEGESYQGWTESGVYQRNLVTEFGCDSVVITNLTVNEQVNAVVQNISLKKGWNIISSYLVSNPSSFDSILKPICDNGYLMKVLDEERNAFKQQKKSNGWINNIGNLEITEGYKIRVENNCSLNIKGQPAELPLAIQLKKGVNLVSFPYNEAVNALDVIQPLIDSGVLYKVQDERGNAIEYWKNSNEWRNRIGDFIPGEGYIVIMDNDFVLQINDSYKKSGILYNDYFAPEHFSVANIGNGPEHMNINIINLINSDLQIGDEIAAFDGNICVGAIKLDEFHFSNNVVSLNATMADENENNGFSEGNPIELRIWSSKDKCEIAYKTQIEDGAMIFEKQASVFVNLNKSAVSASSIFDYTTIDVYPNPASEKVTVHFSEIPEPETTIILSDMAGKIIEQRRVQSTNEILSVAAQAPGMYFIKTISGNQSKINKLVIR